MARKTIRHTLYAGHDLDGSPPLGSAIESGSVAIFSPQNRGGEFSLGGKRLLSVHVRAGGQRWCRVAIVHGDLKETIVCQFPGPDRVLVWNGRVELDKHDKVVVRTRGCKAPITCEAVYEE